MAGALKVILGGIGGALQGARSDSKTDFGDSMSKLDDVAKKKKPTPDEDPVKPESVKPEPESKPVVEEKPAVEEQKEEPAVEEGSSDTLSDKNLKAIYGDNIDDKIIENFAKLSAIDFQYTPEAQAEYANELNVDDKEHIGVIAQELENNEATEGAVEHNENGDLTVNADQLTMADTAAIAELSRRVLALEQAVKELANK